MPRQLIAAIALMALAFGPLARAADTPKPAEAHNTEVRAHDSAAAGAGEAHAPSGHGEAKPNILEPQPSVAIWTVVVFLGLLFVLGKFAWKPLLLALHQREEHLEHVLLDTERARNEAEKLLAEHRRQVAEAEASARALIEEARTQARATAEEIIQKARAEAEVEQKRARHEIETARDHALSEIWTKTADLAVSVAGKVLAKDLSGDDHRRLVASAMSELPVLGNGQGSHSA
ncbi:F-type H+-transporting ATPase subunit b [Singulisphaera sp. GP187]|uniref:F0F1 ATP synthase subunit B n=1 Tax=Singulisphaera sp. GP187 TaxID=1882752 RepID=UPI00092A569B|nr:F0F1 ATP synthase subunit B [Singulisphaera sp. GP187]SIO21672.1 F-type H+-transporting ATPase subunit b [Singulisphaera sp. GP187]